MRIVILGGTGHIGTYLAPRLLALGHNVINVSRGQQKPYHSEGAWRRIEQVQMDRQSEEAARTFGPKIADLQPDVVVDLICFTLESVRPLVEALEGKVRQFLHCGTIWVHGSSEIIPTEESAPRRPFGDYGNRKAEIEEYLLTKAQRDGFPACVLHPGHIVGAGWIPVNPAGHRELSVFEQLASGQEITLPDMGLYTLHHVHADDVAQGFQRAIECWASAVGESFHLTSPQALTMRGYAAAMAAWFGQEVRIRYVPWDEWVVSLPPGEAAIAFDHALHSPCVSIEKARRSLGYQPRYTSLEAIFESLEWLVAQGRLSLVQE